MPYQASQLERAYRIAPVVVTLLNERNEPEDVTLNVKYRPLTYSKLQEWDAAEAALLKVEVSNGKKGKVKETVAEAEARLAHEAEEKRREQTVLARQLADVVFDLDLVEDDGTTPKRVTYEYLLTLDIGFLKDIKREIEDRAFPEKKELRQAMLSRLSRSGT